MNMETNNSIQSKIWCNRISKTLHNNNYHKPNTFSPIKTSSIGKINRINLLRLTNIFLKCNSRIQTNKIPINILLRWINLINTTTNKTNNLTSPMASLIIKLLTKMLNSFLWTIRILIIKDLTWQIKTFSKALIQIVIKILFKKISLFNRVKIAQIHTKAQMI